MRSVAQADTICTHVVEEILYSSKRHLGLDELRDGVDDPEYRHADHVEGCQRGEDDSACEWALLDYGEVGECGDHVD